MGVRVGTMGDVPSEVARGAVGVKAGVRVLLGVIVCAETLVGDKVGDAKSTRLSGGGVAIGVAVGRAVARKLVALIPMSLAKSCSRSWPEMRTRSQFKASFRTWRLPDAVVRAAQKFVLLKKRCAVASYLPDGYAMKITGLPVCPSID